MTDHSLEAMIDELLTDNDDLTSTDKIEGTLMTSIELSGECTIYEILQLHQQIHDNWNGETRLELDVSAVTEVDASFIQLLAVCKHTAENNQQNFQLINPSETLNEKMNAMFMQDFFSQADFKESRAEVDHGN